jgi:hypothetical protein
VAWQVAYLTRLTSLHIDAFTYAIPTTLRALTSHGHLRQLRIRDARMKDLIASFTSATPPPPSSSSLTVSSSSSSHRNGNDGNGNGLRVFAIDRLKRYEMERFHMVELLIAVYHYSNRLLTTFSIRDPLIHGTVVGGDGRYSRAG